MALNTQDLKRIFKHGDIDLADPNPQFTLEECIAWHSVKNPELTTATIAGPTIDGDKAIYEFKTTVGTKG